MDQDPSIVTLHCMIIKVEPMVVCSVICCPSIMKPFQPFDCMLLHIYKDLTDKIGICLIAINTERKVFWGVHWEENHPHK